MRKATAVLLTGSLLLTLAACGSDGAQTPQAASGVLRNPVTPNGSVSESGHDTPDPWIQFVDGAYYMTYTQTLAPHVEMRRSTTLAGLADAAPIVVWSPLDDLDAPASTYQDLWAPEFHRLKNPEGAYRWYIYVAPAGLSLGVLPFPFNQPQHRQHVLESAGDDPLGPYHYKAQLIDDFSIDATVFAGHDGFNYVIWAGYLGEPLAGLPTEAPEQVSYLARLENPWTLASEPVLINLPEYVWENVGAPTSEGPAVLIRGNSLHVIYSTSFCGTDEYKLGRLTVPYVADYLDPATWTGAKQPEPVFEKSPENGVYGPGHNGFFKSPDGSEDWMVYHAHDQALAPATGGGCIGVRTARAQKFSWRADDTPDFGIPLSLDADMPAPAGDGGRAWQFEDLSVIASSGDALDILGDDNTLIGGAAANYAADAAGDFVTFGLNGADLRGQLRLRLLTGPEGGRFSVQLDGQALGSIQDTYAPQAGRLEIDLGALNTIGDALTIQVAGSHAASSGASIGLDQIRLIPD